MNKQIDTDIITAFSLLKDYIKLCTRIKFYKRNGSIVDKTFNYECNKINGKIYKSFFYKLINHENFCYNIFCKSKMIILLIYNKYNEITVSIYIYNDIYKIIIETIQKNNVIS
jgi:hypothetical protein